MRETSNIGTFNASGCERSARGLWQRSGAVFGVVVVLVAAFAVPAVANNRNIPAADGKVPGIGVSWTVSTDSGATKAEAIVYTVTVSAKDDCLRERHATQSDFFTFLNDSTRSTDRDKWFKLRVVCSDGNPNNFAIDTGLLAVRPTGSDVTGEFDCCGGLGAAEVTFQLSRSGVGPVYVDVQVAPLSTSTNGKLTFRIFAPAVTSSGGGGGSISTPSPDPRAATVAVVAEQVAAAGVEGSANGVRVRGSEVLPVTSRLLGAIGPRGGVALSSDGLEVRVASVLGARADAGVLVPTNGVFEASVTGPLLPGSVIEVWINSTPRLVAAAEVPEDGDTAILIPTGTPLDGGEPIEDGAHTLELRLFTEDGFEVVATGITIGQVVPTRIPAGEGPVQFVAVLLALLGAAGAVVAGRRLVTAG